MNGVNWSHFYIGFNLLITVFGIASFSPWGFIAAFLSFLNAYGQYTIIKNNGGIQ